MDLETSQSDFFVLDQVEDGIQADHFQGLQDALGGAEDLALAARLLQGSEDANQNADAGAVHLRDAGQIDGQVLGAAVDQLFQLVAESLDSVDHLEGALEVKNGGFRGLANVNHHLRLAPVTLRSPLACGKHLDRETTLIVGTNQAKPRAGPLDNLYLHEVGLVLKIYRALIWEAIPINVGINLTSKGLGKDNPGM